MAVVTTGGSLSPVPWLPGGTFFDSAWVIEVPAEYRYQAQLPSYVQQHVYEVRASLDLEAVHRRAVSQIPWFIRMAW